MSNRAGDAGALWGGRFEGGPAESVAALSRSIHFDWRLASYDIAGTRAHIKALHSAGYLTVPELEKLDKSLAQLLKRIEDGSFSLTEKQGDSNKSFSYHLYLKHAIEQAIVENKVEKYHFTLLRNLYEKTANFLGYPKWSELLPDDKQLYLNRVIQFTSHSTLSNEAVAEPTQAEKTTVKLLLDHLKSNYGYWQQEQQNG